MRIAQFFKEGHSGMFGRAGIFRSISFAALCLFHGLAVAKEMPRYGIFVYSNLCKSAMSGDLYGTRITVRRLFDGDTLLYEYTDGNTRVAVADNLKLDAKSGTISFEVHGPDNLNTTVSASFSGDGRSLTLQGLLFDEKPTSTLNLIRNFAAPIQECK